MQTVDRRGIHIEQCQGCRGIFLDRGELEQIATAEQTHYGTPAPPPAAPPAYGAPAAYPAPGYAAPPPAQYGHAGYRDSPPPFGRAHRDSPPPYGSHGGQYGHKKRRKSFMEELFD